MPSAPQVFPISIRTVSPEMKLDKVGVTDAPISVLSDFDFDFEQGKSYPGQKKNRNILDIFSLDIWLPQPETNPGSN